MKSAEQAINPLTYGRWWFTHFEQPLTYFGRSFRVDQMRYKFHFYVRTSLPTSEYVLIGRAALNWSQRHSVMEKKSLNEIRILHLCSKRLRPFPEKPTHGRTAHLEFSNKINGLSLLFRQTSSIWTLNWLKWKYASISALCVMIKHNNYRSASDHTSLGWLLAGLQANKLVPMRKQRSRREVSSFRCALENRTRIDPEKCYYCCPERLTCCQMQSQCCS